MSLAYKIAAVAVALAALASACLSPDDEQIHPPRSSRSALGAGADAASAADASACGAVTSQGCCKGSVLYYCASGTLQTFDCSQNPKCGWDGKQSFYNCGTGGSPDPSGKHPMACGAVSDMGTTSLPDLYVAKGPCGSVTSAGCCLGQVLHVCMNGQLLKLDCLPLLKFCGWAAGSYFCSQYPTADPTGKHPRACAFDAAVPDLGTKPDASLPCGTVPYEGCCEGETLKKCDKGELVIEDCTKRPKCGWDIVYSWYRCGIPDGKEEPSKKLPKACSAYKDAGVPDGALPCGNVGWRGCCHGETSYRCRWGTLRIEDCRRQPKCGWGHDYPWYSCGMSGEAQKAGKYPKHCNFGDAGPPAYQKNTCGGITWQGCCDGQFARYCVAGQLRYDDCSSKLHCGWKTVDDASVYGIYGCSTAGKADPSGLLPKACAADAGVEASGCGAVTRQGCCAGDRLYFCEDGTLKGMDCGKNPSCGWQAAAGYYDCGTDGDDEPTGKHPRTCSFDGGPPPLDAAPAVDLSILDSQPPPEPGDAGCGCGVGPRAPGGVTLLLLLLLLLLAVRSCRPGRAPGGTSALPQRSRRPPRPDPAPRP